MPRTKLKTERGSRSSVGLSPNPLAQLIAIADTDKVARLRLLRALRDLAGAADE